MSNAVAIAAVTATLRSLLLSTPDLPDGTHVTALSPEEAYNSTFDNQINLFLYHVLPNAAWRNQDLVGMVKPGEIALPPLALTLYYALMTYHRENTDLADIASHILLGRAMNMLSDHPLLDPDEIKQALPGNDLYLQPERIRITFQPLSLEDISKIWMSFRVRYQVSVAYEVSVVLIESKRPIKTPLPVLTRGPRDIGIIIQPNLLPPVPTLLALEPPQQPCALPGDDLILRGYNLRPGVTSRADGATIDNTNTSVRFVNVHWPEPREVPLKGEATATTLTVTLPDPPVTELLQWPAGFYVLAVVFKDAAGNSVSVTNELSFSLAPRILAQPPMAATRDPITGLVNIALSCQPTINVDQRVSLLVGDHEFLFGPLTDPLEQLIFQAGSLAAGDYLVRLRVDGVDSLLVIWRDGAIPVFDATQKVTVPT